MSAERPAACRCEPWAQRWKAETPERCCACGGLFAPHTVNARRVEPRGTVYMTGESFLRSLGGPEEVDLDV